MLDGHRRRASHGVPVTAGGCILTGMSWLSNRADDAGTADQGAGAVPSAPPRHPDGSVWPPLHAVDEHRDRDDLGLWTTAISLAAPSAVTRPTS